MNILSFGGGVQTVALALMSINGDLPMPDVAIFADPQWEGEKTYSYLEWFIPYAKERGLEIITVTEGNIREKSLGKQRYASMPLFTQDEHGKIGILRRQCTNEYKIQPVYRKARELLGLKPYERSKEESKLWLGISTDEAIRMKPSRVKWIDNYYPLIEHGLSRGDCLAYINRSGLPIPAKSACVGCPFHSDLYWQNIKEQYPKDFSEAVEFDKAIRHHSRKGINAPIYLHRSCKPLDEVDFTKGQIDMFGNECDGYCGL